MKKATVRRRAPVPVPSPAPRPTPASAIVSSLAKQPTLEQLAYRDIRKAIVEGSLAPGQKIVANAIAAAAGISRIPVMQALRRLESDGFVRITPHKDVVVRTLSPDEFRERFLLMAALEALCVREAAARVGPEHVRRLRELQRELRAARDARDTARAVDIDGRFHRLLWHIAGLTQVAQILENVWDRGEYYRTVMHARRGGFAAESLAEHEQVIRALEDGDVTRAARALEQHRLKAMERLTESAQISLTQPQRRAT